MGMLNKKEKYVILAVCMCCFLMLTFYSYRSMNQNSNKNNQITSSSIVDSQAPDNIEKRLMIGSGCIGCGKCARIDSEHFSMDNRQAQVISQSNLDSNNLAMAIRGCHSKVISLN